MKRMMILKILVATAALVLLAPAGMAQCVSDVPAELHIDDTYCVQICPWAYYPSITLVGNLDGPEAKPVLIFSPGCHPDATDCENSTCTPIDVPNLIFGGYPYPGYEDQWYGINDCMEVFFYFGHDNFWYIDILPWECEGCFCITFDYQLAVSLTAFDATGGAGEVTLAWRTASETDNDHFEIERDGQVVWNEPGLGTSATGQSYSWIDRNVTGGTTYAYTLWSVDVSGHRSSHGTVNATPTSSIAAVTEYALYQNYPNPFNPTTTIKYDVPKSSQVVLNLYNMMGEKVMTLVDKKQEAGRYTVNINAGRLASGIYFCRMQAGTFVQTRKMMLLK